MLRLRHAVTAAVLLLPASALAQRPVSVSATVTVTARVAAILDIVAIQPAAASSGASGGNGADLVSIRANVPHRVAVRPAGTATAELRTGGGQWVAATAFRPMEFAGGMGESTYRVECRGTADACNLVYELRSSDPEFPVRTSGSYNRIAGASGVTRIATTS